MQEKVTGKQLEGHLGADALYDQITSKLAFAHGENLPPISGGNNHLMYSYEAAGLQNDLAKVNNTTELDVTRILNSIAALSRALEVERIERFREFHNKKRASSRNGGALDLCSRMAVLAERSCRDFRDAYDRLSVAYAGLCEFYGYDYDKAHQSPPVLVSEKDGFGPIDACVIGIRDATRWLAAFLQLDQEWSTSFSLRNLVTDAVWQTSPSKLSFFIPLQFFTSHSHLRLRGITAYFISSNVKVQSPWAASIGLPVDALSYQGQNEPKTIRQNEVPRCYLGRIDARDSRREPDIAGAISLMNASPIGDPDREGAWSMWITSPHGSTLPLNSLDDLVLELRLVGRPKDLGADTREKET